MFRSWFSKPLSINNSRMVIDNGLFIRPPQVDDFEKWRELRSRNREFLVPWEPSWPIDDLSPTGYRRRLLAYDRQRYRGDGYAWFIWFEDEKENRLVGGISISSIRYGASRTGTIGYWLGEEFCGRGIMKRVVERVCQHGFDDLGLLRLQAACLPDNQRSKRVLEQCGFNHEGMARQYLEINGTRRDHLTFARLAGNELQRNPQLDNARGKVQ